ncbi:MAG TPA: hypothetical protein EYN66_08835 [Myxococcales bacterium]|nr:hypothetical protein [Myxococcales bacterium]
MLKDKETAKRVDAAKATLASLKSSTETLDADLSKKRKAWVGAFDASIPAETVAWAPWEPPKPLPRLTAWLKANGIIFVLGLILIIAGGLLARKVQREEATATPQQDDGSAATPVVDFEVLLKTLNEATLSLHATLSENTDPDEAAFNDAQSRIETIQEDQVNRLVDARISVQVRYGVAGFAQIFGPMSAGERNLNRAWSAIVDCHWPEAVSSMEYAAGQFEDACKQMESLRQTPSQS